jgi:flagellar motor component MotA
MGKRDEEERKRHEYLLKEIRLSAEDVKDYIADKVEPRITSLEDTRTYCRGVLKTVGIGIPALGSVAWFVLELAKSIKIIKSGN